MGLIPELKRILKNQRDSGNPFIRHGVGLIFLARNCARFCFDGTYRSIVQLHWSNSRFLHQTTPLTWLDRYPGIFSACKTHLGDKQDLKILSFGCSTGEEVLTLRHYFPTAFITGAEINRRSLAHCRKREVDARIAFVYSDRKTLRRLGPFDAIFCMAVLQRTPQTIQDQGITSLKEIYPFEKFDEQIGELDLMLKPDGLLVLHHTQYAFRDASVAGEYEPLVGVEHEASPGPDFDRNSEKVTNPSASESIFIKRGP